MIALYLQAEQISTLSSSLTQLIGQLIVFKSPDKYINSTKTVLTIISKSASYVEEQCHYYLPFCCEECLNETSRTGSINAATCTAQYSITDFRNYSYKKKLTVNFQNFQ